MAPVPSASPGDLCRQSAGRLRTVPAAPASQHVQRGCHAVRSPVSLYCRRWPFGRGTPCRRAPGTSRCRPTWARSSARQEVADCRVCRPLFTPRFPQDLQVCSARAGTAQVNGLRRLPPGARRQAGARLQGQPGSHGGRGLGGEQRRAWRQAGHPERARQLPAARGVAGAHEPVADGRQAQHYAQRPQPGPIELVLYLLGHANGLGGR